MEIYITKKEKAAIQIKNIDIQVGKLRLVTNKLIRKEQSLSDLHCYKKRCKVKNLILINKNKILKLFKKRNELTREYFG